MNTSLTMELKPSVSTNFMTKRRKKIALWVGVGIGILAMSAFAVSSVLAGPEEVPAEISPTSDLADLARPRPTTNHTVAGTVTVNGQFPLGMGHVVAYDSNMQAIAACPLDKLGNYLLTNVPPGKLTLLIKREINDDPNPVAEKQAALHGSSVERKGTQFKVGEDGSKIRVVSRGENDKMRNEPSTPAFLKQKGFSPEALSKIRFSVSTPEFESLPEVKWMTKVAFYKYGNFSPRNRLVVQPSDDEQRIHLIYLAVP